MAIERLRARGVTIAYTRLQGLPIGRTERSTAEVAEAKADPRALRGVQKRV